MKVEDMTNLPEVRAAIAAKLESLRNVPNRCEGGFEVWQGSACTATCWDWGIPVRCWACSCRSQAGVAAQHAQLVGQHEQKGGPSGACEEGGRTPPSLPGILLSSVK